MTCRLKQFTPLFTMILRSQEVGQLSNQTASRRDKEGAIQNVVGNHGFLTILDNVLTVNGSAEAIRELAGLSFNQEASQKKLEWVRKIEWWPTSPRCSGSSKSAAKNMKNTLTSPGPMLKKLKIKAPLSLAVSFLIYVFRELSKHTVVLYLFSL